MKHKTLMAAEKYSIFCFSTIPLMPNSKRPALESWTEFQTRRPTWGEIQSWWGNNSDNNIAIVCGRVSNLVVLDIDDPDKFEVALKAIGETLPDTPVVKTRKGWHVYFRYPANRIVRRHDRLSDWGCELRGDGCYVVAPPSVVDGHRYHWAKRNGKLMALGKVPLSDPPDWLLDAFSVPFADADQNQTLSPQTVLNGSTLSLEQKQAIKAVLSPYWHEGTRHNLALGLAGLLAKAGIAKDEALKLLREIADEANDREWRDRERALQDTFERLWRGETVVGFKRLEEVLGDQIAKVIANIVQVQPFKNKSAIGLLTLKEWDEKLATVTSGTWLVEGLLQAGWLLVLNARPKVGKSIVAVNLATALATSNAFLNRQTSPCSVIYIDLERPLETLNRFKVLGALENPHIFVPNERVGADMLDALHELVFEAQKRTDRPVVVFVDTLGDFIKPALRQRKASINDYDAIADILQAVRDLALETGCAFVFVHHLRKAQSDEPSEVDVLGSTAIAGKFDVIANLHPDRTDASVLTLVAEGNAIAKTVLHFAIEADFKLSPCEPPAKTKEEQAAKAIEHLLKQHPAGLPRAEIVRYLTQIGLAETVEGAQSLFRRASALLALETKRLGHRVFYLLPDPSEHGHVGHYIESDHFDHIARGKMVNMVNMVSDGLTNLTNLTTSHPETWSNAQSDDHIDDHFKNPSKTRRFAETWSKWSNTNIATNDHVDHQNLNAEDAQNLNVQNRCPLCDETLEPERGLAVCVGCGRLWRLVGTRWQLDLSPEPDFCLPEPEPVDLDAFVRIAKELANEPF